MLVIQGPSLSNAILIIFEFKLSLQPILWLKRLLKLIVEYKIYASTHMIQNVLYKTYTLTLLFLCTVVWWGCNPFIAQLPPLPLPPSSSCLTLFTILCLQWLLLSFRGWVFNTTCIQWSNEISCGLQTIWVFCDYLGFTIVVQLKLKTKSNHKEPQLNNARKCHCVSATILIIKNPC